MQSPRVEGPLEEVRRRFSDLLDGAIEIAAKPLGRPFWQEMKENARLASESGTGGARLAARELATLAAQHPGLSLHLACHSAGAVFMAHLVPLLVSLGVPVASLSLMAPACTTALFKEKLSPHLGAGVAEFALFNLSAERELDDSVGPYRKSLLYLVSNAFEEERKTPLLGMEAYVAKDRALVRRLGAAKDSDPTRIRDVGLSRRTLRSASETHTDFDEDAHTLNSMLRIVSGTNRIPVPFA